MLRLQWDNQINVYFINLVVLQFRLGIHGLPRTPIDSFRLQPCPPPLSSPSFIITLPYNESLLAYRLTRSYRVLELPSLITVRWNRRISFAPSLTPPIFPLTGHSCARYANFYRSPRFIDSSVDGNRVVRRVRGAGARRRRSGPSSQRIIIMNEHGRQTRGPASSALDRSAVRIIGAER